MNTTIRDQHATPLEDFLEVKLAILSGSVAAGQKPNGSDVELGVASHRRTRLSEDTLLGDYDLQEGRRFAAKGSRLPEHVSPPIPRRRPAPSIIHCPVHAVVQHGTVPEAYVCGCEFAGIRPDTECDRPWLPHPNPAVFYRRNLRNPVEPTHVAFYTLPSAAEWHLWRQLR